MSRRHEVLPARLATPGGTALITNADGTPVLAALLPRDVTEYAPPAGFAALSGADGDVALWRVAALGTGGRVLTTTTWRKLRIR